MTPAAWLFLVLFAVLTISITIVANRPAPSGGPTPRENGPPPSLEKFAAPAHTAPPWTIAGIADCSAGSLSIGNATDQEITFISGKFVVERHYSAKETEWHTDTELGGFFAELVPPHGWRRSVSYGPLQHLCGDYARIRIVRLDRCIINERDLGNACAVNMQPIKPESWQIPVVGLQ